MSLISFVIPCYRSEKTLHRVVKEIRDTVANHHTDQCEIILVDDCSPDHTWETIQHLCVTYDNIFGITLAKNFGQHAALMAGFAHASGETVVCLDDDGQTPANQMYRLLEKMDEGFDVVYAEYPKKKHSIFRNLGSRINKLMTELLLDKPKGLYQSSYFAARRFVIEEILRYQNPYPYTMGLVLRTTSKISNVMVDHRDRTEGETGYTFRKLLHLLVNGFTAFSVKPLRMATVSGIALSCLGLIYGLYAFINKLINPNTPLGWTSMIIVLLIVGGMILFVLGLIGEYVGRIYICLNNSPQYVVRAHTERGQSDVNN